MLLETQATRLCFRKKFLLSNTRPPCQSEISKLLQNSRSEVKMKFRRNWRGDQKMGAKEFTNCSVWIVSRSWISKVSASSSEYVGRQCSQVKELICVESWKRGISSPKKVAHKIAKKLELRSRCIKESDKVQQATLDETNSGSSRCQILWIFEVILRISLISR